MYLAKFSMFQPRDRQDRELLIETYRKEVWPYRKRGSFWLGIGIAADIHPYPTVAGWHD